MFAPFYLLIGLLLSYVYYILAIPFPDTVTIVAKPRLGNNQVVFSLVNPQPSIPSSAIQLRILSGCLWIQSHLSMIWSSAALYSLIIIILQDIDLMANTALPEDLVSIQGSSIYMMQMGRNRG